MLIRLDERLSIVAKHITGAVHLDIGSDHGKLLCYLLQRNIIEHGIAVENKQTPFRNSQKTLHGLNAEVYLGDGFEPVSRPVDSVSMCGMGGELIVRILAEAGAKLPSKLILQPNTKIELVRRWAARENYHLVSEDMTHCGHAYVILALKAAKGADVAYSGVEPHLAELLGPLLIKKQEAHFIARMKHEQQYLRGLPARTSASQHRLECIGAVLESLCGN